MYIQKHSSSLKNSFVYFIFYRAVASHFCAQGELMNFAPPPEGRTEKLVSGRDWREYLPTFFSTQTNLQNFRPEKF
jgi:hypothetical protein